MTKVDLVKDEKELTRVHEQLLAAGATKLFEVSSVEKTGLAELIEYLGGES